MRFTPEQAHAIERRKGDMLLDAGAGSGKTTVLVERFARAVQEDGVDVSAILTITFTEKAAAELRDRIRTRLRAVGDDAAALATEGAWISTIHSFCVRVLRTHALAAGLDPRFTVLDEHDAAALQESAFDLALAEIARTDDGADLIAAHGPRSLRASITKTYGALRAGGQLRPRLPSGGGADIRPLGGRSAERARLSVIELAHAVRRELGGIGSPGKQVSAALLAIERVPRLLSGGVPWPGELEQIELPGGNAKALRSDACEQYRVALEELRLLSGEEHAVAARAVLDALLIAYGDRYSELKRGRSGLDFEDLELLAREVLRRKDIGRRYRERFARVMVDEMQDTNHVQLELIDLVAGVDLFMVGDAQQSIYGFRHADVELFEERGRKLEAIGARASLQTNFRSRAEILTPLNAAFAQALGQQFRSLLPGREDPRTSEPLVELLIVDRDVVAYSEDQQLLAQAGGTALWRLTEARALAARIAELVLAGAATPGEVVVLMRATTDMQVYERALAEAGVPTYVIGGRGYWEQPQVIQLSSYLRALANPLDQEAWCTTLLSPLCGVSLDGLVLVAAGARDRLTDGDRERLRRFEAWFTPERSAATRLGAEALIDRALAFSGYDLTVAAMPGGRRRLANIRKLMRLAREWEAGHGADLGGFVELVRSRVAGRGGVRESEAPVESESLDAVRLMTIHRSKGLEFPIVCVADLGRKQPAGSGGLVRVGRDGQRLGLQIKRPGSSVRINTLAYEELGEQEREIESAEERRLFYVAMTRARERLIVSGAASFNDWEESNRSAPIGWLARAFVPDIARRALASNAVAVAIGARAGAPPFTTKLGVQVSFIARVPPLAPRPPSPPIEELAAAATRPVFEMQLPRPAARRLLSTLSYTSLATYQKCGYRFYAEHVVRLPAAPEAALTPPPPEPTESDQGSEPPAASNLGLAPAAAAARGTAVHRILAALDFRHPVTPLGTAADVRPLVANFTASPIFNRLSGLSDLSREQRFAFSFRGVLITGAFDVFARDPRTGGALVVDYKSDRLGDATPAQLTSEHYGVQRTIYALAALRTGVPGVEVLHVFLEDPDRPVVAVHTVAEIATLEADLAMRMAGPLAGDFSVTQTPGRLTCSGCPARGGLCSWPIAATLY